MSRPLRMQYPGAWYHVMNRGRREETVFLSRNDYETFIKVLQETTDQWNLQISAYCLMSNHYHLLAHSPEGNLSRCMRHINGVYTQRYNRRHNKDGPLFRGRYKAVLVEADNHLLEVLRYIHRNPLRAGITEQLNEFTWCSHKGYLSKAKKWEWLHKNILLSMLSSKKTKRKSAYIDFVLQIEPKDIEKFYSLKNLPSILGNEPFKEWVKEKFQHLMLDKEIPASRELATSPKKIIDTVCKHFMVTRKQIATSKRGTENLPRDIAIYLVRYHSRDTLAIIGTHFGISNYSTVSSAVERIKLKMKKDQILRKHLKTIEGKFKISHTKD